MVAFVNRIAYWIKLFAYWLSIMGGVILVFSMAAVLADVFTRTLFGATGGNIDLTFRGSYEIVRYGLLLSILYALPYALKDGQVIVEIFTEKMPEKFKNWIAGCFVFFFGVFGFLLSSGLLDRIENASRSGETSQDFGIPMGYLYSFALVGALMLGIRGISVTWEYFMTETGEDE